MWAQITAFVDSYPRSIRTFHYKDHTDMGKIFTELSRKRVSLQKMLGTHAVTRVSQTCKTQEQTITHRHGTGAAGQCPTVNMLTRSRTGNYRVSIEFAVYPVLGDKMIFLG